MNRTSPYRPDSKSIEWDADEQELAIRSDEPEPRELEQPYCSMAMKEVAKGILFFNAGLIAIGSTVYHMATCVDVNCTDTNSSLMDPNCASNFSDFNISSNNSTIDPSDISCATGSAILIVTGALFIGKSLVNLHIARNAYNK